MLPWTPPKFDRTYSDVVEDELYAFPAAEKGSWLQRRQSGIDANMHQHQHQHQPHQQLQQQHQLQHQHSQPGTTKEDLDEEKIEADSAPEEPAGEEMKAPAPFLSPDSSLTQPSAPSSVADESDSDFSPGSPGPLPPPPTPSKVSKGAHVCPHCAKRFTKAHTLALHRRNHASSSPPPTAADGNTHQCALRNSATGQPCNTFFRRPYDLIRHQETIHAQRRKVWTCDECVGKTFSRADALVRHRRAKHGKR